MKRLSFVDALTGTIALATAFLLLQTISAKRDARALEASQRAQRDLIVESWPEVERSSTRLFDQWDSTVVVEAIQYRCPGCMAIAPAVDSAITAGVKLALVHVPALSDSAALQGAALVICAQSIGRGLEVHRHLLSDSSWATRTAGTAVQHLLDGEEKRALAFGASRVRSGEVRSPSTVASQSTFGFR